MSLRLADDIRGYVAAVNARNGESMDPVPEEQMVDWSRWALEQAERIDPVRTRAFLQPAPEPVGESDPKPNKRARASVSDPEWAQPSWHPRMWYTRLHK
jgi:hypothetical protein